MLFAGGGHGVIIDNGKFIIDSSFSTRLIIDSQNHKTKINNMKRAFIIAAMMLTMITASAKKVTVTIDGTVYRTQEKIYLIVDEDTANAVVVPVQNGQFTVTTTVDANSIIRLHETKEWPERAEFVIIPDSKHITADLNSSTIEGSPMSQRLRTALSAIKREDPEGFHIDVFSDDPEAWRQAQEAGESMRRQMRETQRTVAFQQMRENSKNIIPAWIAYCYYSLLEPEVELMLKDKKQKWTKHPILMKIQGSD